VKRIALAHDTVERDLVRLPLTIVELLRQLMERQVLRRVDEGTLTRGGRGGGPGGPRTRSGRGGS
jgi:hypothetical protein